MDAELASSWKRLYMTPGIFRNATYGATERRQLGWLGVVVQYNASHLLTKRPASSPDTRLVRPVDPAHFNFSKAKQDEVVLRFVTSCQHSARLLSSGQSTVADDQGHTIFVNVNPLIDLHCLLVPHYPRAVEPQLLTAARLEPALHLSAAVARRDLMIGYNSLGAWATVNHIHWHVGTVGSFMDGGLMPIERADRALVPLSRIPSTSSPHYPSHPTLSTLTNWPIRTLHFALSTTSATIPLQLSALAQLVGSITEDLAEKSIPHNVLVCDQGRSVFVLPRKAQHGVPGEGVLNAALLEICGVAIVHNRDDYERLSPEKYKELLAEASLSEVDFGQIRDEARQRLQQLFTHP